MILSKAARIIPILFLAACASAPAGPPPIPKVVVQTVNVPVAVSCVPAAAGEPPAYKDTDRALKAAPDMAERYALLAGEHAVHQVRESELEAILRGCRFAPPPSP